MVHALQLKTIGIFFVEVVSEVKVEFAFFIFKSFLQYNHLIMKPTLRYNN